MAVPPREGAGYVTHDGLRPIGVSTVPGATALMRIPSGAYSSAADFVSPSTPHFEAV